MPAKFVDLEPCQSSSRSPSLSLLQTRESFQFWASSCLFLGQVARTSSRGEESPINPKRGLDSRPEPMGRAMSVPSISLESLKFAASPLDWDHARKLKGTELCVEWIDDISIGVPRRRIGDELGCDSLQTQLGYNSERKWGICIPCPREHRRDQAPVNHRVTVIGVSISRDEPSSRFLNW